MTLPVLQRTAAALPLALMLALAACSGGQKGARSAGSLPAATRAPLDVAVDLLEQGDTRGAEKQLRAILKGSPNDPSAAVLLESIDRDPVELLGAKSFAYTSQPGDTLQGLSERFLGNRLKFYQLARYNHLDKPAALAAGTALRIPGEPPHAAPTPAPAPAPRPAPKPKPRAKAAPAPAPAAAPARPTTNPAAALRLRAQGLAALNQGKVGDAVGLLHRAAALDPKNPLIARDAARADRIAEAVRARR